MHPRRILFVATLALAAPRAMHAQRYAAPSPDRSAADTTVSFATGDVIRVRSYPSMASGIRLCGTVGQGSHWGKMLFARTDAETNSAQQTVVSFPSTGVTAMCETHYAQGGQWLVVSFSRPVQDEAGRIGRIPIGQIVLPLAPLQRRRVTFSWLREGPFQVPSVTPPPRTLGSPRPRGSP